MGPGSGITSANSPMPNEGARLRVQRSADISQVRSNICMLYLFLVERRNSWDESCSSEIVLLSVSRLCREPPAAIPGGLRASQSGCVVLFRCPHDAAPSGADRLQPTRSLTHELDGLFDCGPTRVWRLSDPRFAWPKASTETCWCWELLPLWTSDSMFDLETGHGGPCTLASFTRCAHHPFACGTGVSAGLCTRLSGTACRPSSPILLRSHGFQGIAER